MKFIFTHSNCTRFALIHGSDASSIVLLLLLQQSYHLKVTNMAHPSADQHTGAFEAMLKRASLSSFSNDRKTETDRSESYKA